MNEETVLNGFSAQLFIVENALKADPENPQLCTLLNELKSLIALQNDLNLMKQDASSKNGNEENSEEFYSNSSYSESIQNNSNERGTSNKPYNSTSTFLTSTTACIGSKIDIDEFFGSSDESDIDSSGEETNPKEDKIFETERISFRSRGTFDFNKILLGEDPLKICNDIVEEENLLENQIEQREGSPLNSFEVEQIGNWEQFTKGIGMKLLEKYGYIRGKGIGKRSEGIPVPIGMDLKVVSKPFGLGHKRRYSIFSIFSYGNLFFLLLLFL